MKIVKKILKALVLSFLIMLLLILLWCVVILFAELCTKILPANSMGAAMAIISAIAILAFSFIYVHYQEKP